MIVIDNYLDYMREYLSLSRGRIDTSARVHSYVQRINLHPLDTLAPGVE